MIIAEIQKCKSFMQLEKNAKELFHLFLQYIHNGYDAYTNYSERIALILRFHRV